MTIFPTYITCDKAPAAAAERLAGGQDRGQAAGRDPAARLHHAASTPRARRSRRRCTTASIARSRGTARRRGARRTSSWRSRSRPWSSTPARRKTVSFAVAAATAQRGQRLSVRVPLHQRRRQRRVRRRCSTPPIAPKGERSGRRQPGRLEGRAGRDASSAKAQKAEVTELLRRPWLEIKDAEPDGNFAEFKLAWDENYLYVAARVNDPTPQKRLPPHGRPRRERLLPHQGRRDQRSPYKEFLAKHPGPELRRSALRVALQPREPRPSGAAGDSVPPRPAAHRLDVADDWHDLAPTTDKVPYGFHAVPDTDYEYALYLCRAGRASCGGSWPPACRDARFPARAPRPADAPARCPAPSTWSSCDGNDLHLRDGHSARRNWPN